MGVETYSDMAFVPGVTWPSIVSSRTRWFLVHDQGLVVRVQGGSVSLPETEHLRALGFATDHAHYLGRSDGDDCFALHAGGWVAEEPWSIQSLRGLYGQLQDQLFSVAGRAI